MFAIQVKYVGPMVNISTGIQNIHDGQGLSIAITGMIIVFAALAIISIFIALLPKMLVLLARAFPEEHHHSAPSVKTAKDDDALLAAIGFGLYKTRVKNGIKD